MEHLNYACIKVNRAVLSFVACNGGVCIHQKSEDGGFWSYDGYSRVRTALAAMTTRPAPRAIAHALLPGLHCIISLFVPDFCLDRTAIVYYINCRYSPATF